MFCCQALTRSPSYHDLSPHRRPESFATCEQDAQRLSFPSFLNYSKSVGTMSSISLSLKDAAGLPIAYEEDERPMLDSKVDSSQTEAILQYSFLTDLHRRHCLLSACYILCLSHPHLGELLKVSVTIRGVKSFFDRQHSLFPCLHLE